MINVSYIRELNELREKYVMVLEEYHRYMEAEKRNARYQIDLEKWIGYDKFFSIGEFSVDDLVNIDSRFYKELFAITYLAYVQSNIIPARIVEEYKVDYESIAKPKVTSVLSAMRLDEKYMTWLNEQKIMKQEDTMAWTKKRVQGHREMVELYSFRYAKDLDWVKGLPDFLNIEKKGVIIYS